MPRKHPPSIFHRFRIEVLPKIQESGIGLSLIAPGDTFKDTDVKQALELGALLLLDKPLIVVLAPGAKVGVRLQRAADVVLYDIDPGDPRSMARVTDAITELQRLGIIDAGDDSSAPAVPAH